MKLFSGVLAIMVTVNLFALLAIVSRNPEPSRWKNETLVANFILPMLIFLGICGVMLVVDYVVPVKELKFSWADGATAAGAFVVGVIVLKLLKVKSRLQEFAKQERAYSRGGKSSVHVLPVDRVPDPPVINRRAA